MKFALVALVAALVLGVRLFARRRRRHAGGVRRRSAAGPFSSAVWMIAARDIRERASGKVFRVGTAVILAVVAGAIVIPVVDRSKPHPQEVGVVGTLPAPLRATVVAAAASVGTAVRLVPEADVDSAKEGLRSGRIDLAILDARQVLVDKPIAATDVSTTDQLVRAVSRDLGVTEAVAAARLTPAQASRLASARALPVTSVQPGKAKTTAQATSLIGVILIFVMLTQYNTWILIGVMEEKSSRVVEVLLAAVRPVQLLAGKVLGIGLVAFAQAGLVVAFALILAKAVGSNLLHGTAPLVLVSTLVWLVLGYAFYCWVYAAAGSMAERQDQVQSLALPLSLPIIFGYVFTLLNVSSGSPTTFLKVLAYLPPTAPFAMPVLVGFGAVTWWGFTASAVFSLAATVGMARLASEVYRRAILRTGRRVQLREVFAHSAR